MAVAAGMSGEQKMRNYIAVLAIAAYAGCGDRVERNTVETIDEVCLAGANTVRAKFATCLSSSCDTLVSATCSVSREGEDAVIAGRAEIDRQGDTCTTDCGLVEATCEGSLGEAARIRSGSLTIPRSELEACER